ncbi:c-type cytochrome [Mangrovicoccus algicola]|uniref:Cytochrome c family protein n=1 Tax=Mangrovicoccus algicola TaxID=2771008 RepID=A0A8J6YTH8_9RHOB|nr:cytochrome c family protein [Mangrovicoccus algicola]MBE3637222.1 cytochrome c family protein [Mangrovicoccus algicola]
MFDTMTFTKVAAGLCGTFLVFLLGGWAGELLYHTGGGHGAEGEQAYVIDTGAEEGDAAPEEQVDFATLLASADPASGERVYAKCRACHKLDGTNGTGPHLDGVVGRAIGGVEGFAYSDALAGHGGDWTPEALDHWLENPKGYIPGNKMAFAGLKKIEDRADLVAYLQSVP